MPYEWTNIINVAGVIVILSIVIERGLALLFQHREYGQYFTGKKEAVAFGLSVLVCVVYQIDLLSAISGSDHKFGLGYVLTAGVIAGGSKASIALFSRAIRTAKESTDGIAQIEKSSR